MRSLVPGGGLAQTPRGQGFHVSNVRADHVSHSDALLHFDVANGPWSWLRIRWSVAPQSCQSGRGGTVMSTSYNGGVGPVQSSPHMMVIVAGLPAGQEVNVCPEISKDNREWTSGAGATIRLVAVPAMHPALPELPHATLPANPDTRGFAVWTVGETHKPECDTLFHCLKAAIAEQTAHGTVIRIKAGSKIVGRTWVDDPAGDVRKFASTAIDPRQNTIGLPRHGFHEGQGVVFGTSYSRLPGNPPTPEKCDGLNYGVTYYVHSPSSDGFSLTCDKPAAQGGTALRFRDNGGGNDIRVAPYPRQVHPIVIRTTTPDDQLPPPGVRVTPAWSKKLARLEADKPLLLAPYTGNGLTNQLTSTAVITFGNPDGNVHPMPSNIWLIGLELVTGDNSGAHSDDPEPWYALLDFRRSSSDNVVDRCYIHGRGYPNRVETAVFWNGKNNAFLNNYFDRLDYWHAVNGCQSVPSRHVSEGTNAMVGGEGPGPYIFSNNYVEGAGNLWHHDGGPASMPQDDYLYVRNTFSVPPKYQFGTKESDGRSYYNRQPLEWKGGHRILLDGNRFIHNYHHIAVSTVVMTSVGFNGELGYGIRDVTVTNNTFRHLPAVMTLLSTQGGQFQTPPIDRVLVDNNLMEDINGSHSVALDGTNGCDPQCHCRPWTGWIFQGFGDGEDRIVRHNTIRDTGGIAPALIRMYGGRVEGLKITNNEIELHDGGVSIEGDINDGGGQAECRDRDPGEKLLACKAPGVIFSGNALSSGKEGRAWRDWFSSKQNRQAGQGTSETGVDLTKLGQAQGAVKLSGATAVTSSSAEVRFVAPDAQACPVDASADDPTVIEQFTRFADEGGSHERMVKLSGLRPRTRYYFRVDCAVEQPVGSFQTQ